MAWLLSHHHLSPAELDAAARRIRAGERLSPPPELLARARTGLILAVPGRRRRPPPQETEEPAPAAPGAAPEPSATEPRDWAAEPSLRDLQALDTSGPPGGTLSSNALWLLLLVELLLTPLTGWVTWLLWRRKAPLAARQVLRITLPVSVLFFVAWVAAMGLTWGERWGWFSAPEAVEQGP